MKKYWTLISVVSVCMSFHAQSFSDCVARTCAEINTMPELEGKDRSAICSEKPFCQIGTDKKCQPKTNSPAAEQALKSQTEKCKELGAVQAKCGILGVTNCKWQ